jgi:hypothetical protein
MLHYEFYLGELFMKTYFKLASNRIEGSCNRMVKSL